MLVVCRHERLIVILANLYFAVLAHGRIVDKQIAVMAVKIAEVSIPQWLTFEQRPTPCASPRHLA
jgi:hypothetical protein